MDEQVLVTGGSGFIALQTILNLMEKGYRVRTTLRSLDKAEHVRNVLRDHTPMADMLECVEASLDSDQGWSQAVAGCDCVLHIASPVPVTPPKHDEELIGPARNGALRVLKAAKASDVKRVVMTSSVAAISYGWNDAPPVAFTEEHWSNLDKAKGNIAYARSKTLAEKAAWEFVNSPEGEGLDLATINPAVVLGPVLDPDVSASLQVISQLMSGKIPALPRLSFTIVDVRDVAEAHILAMTTPEAAGKRFILADQTYMADELAQILREEFPAYANKIPKRYIPDWVVRALSIINPPLRQITPSLGRNTPFSNEQAKTVLGLNPRPAREAAIASANSMIALGLL